ncbi:MAG TPA: SAM-dependent methyltransferase, partial [Candidatus Hydrogenedentes bacterium]|nr:SAM-dependent methyltransferase [Candidatus Hydrogenedentota bacterium]
QRKANRACMQAYAHLVERYLPGASRLLELGAGTSEPLSRLAPPLSVALDLSVPMLCGRGSASASARVAADAMDLPFQDASFDAVLCINLLEHVPEPARVVTEAARVLSTGGLFLAVTPNGDVVWLFEALERLHLKLPEGPHRFLSCREFVALAAPLDMIEHHRFLAFPVGPRRLVQFSDSLACGRGLFQYLLARKP